MIVVILRSLLLTKEDFFHAYFYWGGVDFNLIIVKYLE